ncbi:hypothetical protein HMPREF1556_00785 [Porphyromonas sp. oral taxon 278 str. W7784]|nr:hypothetical protein HMPREF1556_00785 [Porphyromonas sp. oral taxon 278 str. W7784]
MGERRGKGKVSEASEGREEGREGEGKRGDGGRAIHLTFRRKGGISLDDLAFLEEMLRRYPRKGVPLINVCIHNLEK